MCSDEAIPFYCFKRRPKTFFFAEYELDIVPVSLFSVELAEVFVIGHGRTSASRLV